MVAYTATYALPYQEASDAPCDAPDVWCAFAEGVESALLSIADGVGMVYPTIPMARVSRTAPYTTDFGLSTRPVVYDTVWVDTADMVNFDVSAYQITIPYDGLWGVTGWLTQASAGGLGLNYDMTLLPNSVGDSLNKTAGVYFMHGTLSRLVTPDGVQQMSIIPALGGETIVVYGAELSVFWLSELP